MKKLTSILIALAMMVVLAVPAFAATASKSSAVGTDATVGLTKTLTVPVGTTIPSDTFSFAIARVTDNGEGENATNYDVTTTVTGITSPTTAKAAPNAGTEATATTATQIINYADVLSGAKFNAAGVYAFDVTEVKPTTGYEAPNFTRTTTDEDGVVTTETIKYSQAEYRLIVGVASYTKDDGTTGYYIDTIQAVQTVADDGTPINPATKPEGDLNPATGEAGAINFTNNYLKSKQNPDPVGGEEEEPKTPDPTDGKTLFISKEITCEDATATIDNDKVFQMTSTVTFPAGATAYKYQIVKADGTPVGAEQTLTKPANSNSKQFTFELKNGERLVFTDIAIGATWTVEEADYPAYEASGEQTTASLVKDTAQNKSEIKNAYDPDEDPATGLSINNLPFIVLALVAIGGLCAYVIVRRKSEDNA